MFETTPPSSPSEPTLSPSSPTPSPTPSSPSPTPTPSSPTEEPREEPTEEPSSAQTYLADDVTNKPTGEVEQAGPVTYQADHVPSDAAPLLSTKVVAAPAAEPAAPAAADAETA